MTALNTVFLILGMAVVGVPLILGLLSPLAGAVVVRVFPEGAWDGVMLLVAQGGAAAATFLIGKLAVGLPWGACLIAAVLVGITSYARRAPDALSYDEHYSSDYSVSDTAYDYDTAYNYDDDAADPSAGQLDERDRDRAVKFCPECGKRCRGEQALSQHTKAKHS